MSQFPHQHWLQNGEFSCNCLRQQKSNHSSLFLNSIFPPQKSCPDKISWFSKFSKNLKIQNKGVKLIKMSSLGIMICMKSINELEKEKNLMFWVMFWETWYIHNNILFPRCYYFSSKQMENYNNAIFLCFPINFTHYNTLDV